MTVRQLAQGFVEGTVTANQILAEHDEFFPNQIGCGKSHPLCLLKVRALDINHFYATLELRKAAVIKLLLDGKL